MAGALLVANEDVLDVVLLEDLVIDRKHGAAGIAEDMLDAVVLQRLHDHFGARHLDCRSSGCLCRSFLVFHCLLIVLRKLEPDFGHKKRLLGEPVV